MSTASGMPDRLITVVGQPKTIALKYKTGKPTRTGNMMYSLTSGLVAFFPPEVAAEIDSLRLDPGQPFTVCHRGGQRWEIERASPTAFEPARPFTNTEKRNEVPPSIPQAPAGPVNGQGENSAAIMTRHYCDAIEIALKAVACAEGRGLRITPAFEDIRAMAATLLINESGRR